MNVDIFDRDTTLVATLTFPNSVFRAFGIASVNVRKSCGDGFQITDFGLTGKDLAGVSVSVIAGAGLYMRVVACDTLACMADLASSTFEALRVRITQILPAQVRAATEKLTEEQMWWRPNEKSNSVANLVLHLSGSLNLYLNHNIGGISYKRDRDGEFAAREPMSKRELMAIFDDMVAKADQTFKKIKPEQLAGPSMEPDKYDALVQDLIGIVTHVANHTGQILWITKMLSEGSLDEVWIRAHKHHGGWKAK